MRATQVTRTSPPTMKALREPCPIVQNPAGWPAFAGHDSLGWGGKNYAASFSCGSGAGGTGALFAIAARSALEAALSAAVTTVAA
jgi:hypothetical protein